MDIPPEFAPYVQDYEVRVFDIAYLPDEVIERFKSDFRMIARFFRNKRLGINPLDDTEGICHVEEFIDFLAVFTKDIRYKKTKEYVEQLEKKGVKVSMCNIAQGLLDEGRAVGRAEGRAEGEYRLIKAFIELVRDGVLTITDAAEVTKLLEGSGFELIEIFITQDVRKAEVM